MLSDKCQAVLDFIREYKTNHDGVPPSRREIVDNCPVKSTSHASEILGKLKDLGLITFTPKEARTIQVVGGRWIFEGDNQLSSVNSKRSVS